MQRLFQKATEVGRVCVEGMCKFLLFVTSSGYDACDCFLMTCVDLEIWKQNYQGV